MTKPKTAQITVEKSQFSPHDEEMGQACYVHTEEYYPSPQKEMCLPFTDIGSIFSEIAPTKVTLCKDPCMCHEQSRKALKRCLSKLLPSNMVRKPLTG